MIEKINEGTIITEIDEKPEEAMFSNKERALNSATDIIKSSEGKLDLTDLKAAIEAHERKFE